MALAMIVPLLSYVFVAYFAFFGSKPRGPLYDNPDSKIIVSH
jgi:fucose permease